MNIVDYVIIAVVGVSVLYGLYRGFVSSVLNTAAGLGTFFASLKLYPKVSAWLAGNESITTMLTSLTDADKLVGDQETALRLVQTLQNTDISALVDRIALPEPLDAILKTNLESMIYGASVTVGEYVTQTVLNVCLNVIAFVVTFAVMYLVISILCNLIREIFRFPVLKQMDGLAGGLFGLLRGFLICTVLFALVPLALTMIPIDGIEELITGSQLADIFTTGNPIVAIMNGSLWGSP